jgi:hypothetical protein
LIGINQSREGQQAAIIEINIRDRRGIRAGVLEPEQDIAAKRNNIGG